MSSVEEHRKQAPQTVACYVITVSDTRTMETDTGGQLLVSMLEEAGYQVVGRTIVKDDYEDIRELVYKSSVHSGIEAVLLTGGTGISPRDTTYEAVASLLDKSLPGFGEIFRLLSFTEDIGSAAILSRAIAGTIGNTAVFSMPGSTGAIRLAMSRLIVPELRHVMREIYKKE
ncbi:MULTISPECIES: MogA/MoaB family molybdenum cofactor biosynthesis protein [unclassified Paenibacillus]|uniref:MogA/MoaB family molybdenum cofactor biosynthesis protein n=1 Tax=unclassified Paenibacillus TaxID=185978 RepID=UPI0024055420|nr:MULTISPECIES: MogA/MoaB family molybdenum cofactor biosynthesis protein [unclassified Paenibacillus]MDF9841005.1 molybdenum cofactor biosynthesis protein B [Paenibacillus sp. PastF-2]MDF9847822.1 molybdenum cofactor biosynthesis protein B [Paenibacillus sp. PastM-2]MDF9854391.1 molybdenum cofactor biosynthesis protein B [Paenibacillus sp. PastF-1]MDH6479438.1 molybdenum cofactor biosynthesis protein B [Paenibacillus sp. PastH-2]MDH6505104.1 molybdenum cofactor biosynthesis protein B [Paenib